MAQPTDPADARASLGELADSFERLLHERVRGVAPLVWVEETFDDEFVGVSTVVRPARAHSGGVTVTAYVGSELGVAVGPSEFRFLAHRAEGLERAASATAAAVGGGARVEVYRRWWRNSTRTVVPAFGYPVATSVWHHEFPGYPLGVHFVQAALITETGMSGRAITHTAAEVAIGTATKGDQQGAKVSITDTGAFWFQWEGPDEHQYNDAVYEADEMRDVLHEYGDEVAWDWMDPEFAAWIESAS